MRHPIIFLIFVPILLLIYPVLINLIAYTDFNTRYEARKAEKNLLENLNLDQDEFNDLVEDLGNPEIINSFKTEQDIINFLNENYPSINIGSFLNLFAEKGSGMGVERIGLQESVGVKLEREYFFGLIRLPVKTDFVGSLRWIHRFFFAFIYILIALLILLEILSLRKKPKTI